MSASSGHHATCADNPLLMLWTTPTPASRASAQGAGRPLLRPWFQKDDQDHLLSTSILVWPRPTASQAGWRHYHAIHNVGQILENSALGPPQKGLKEPIRRLGEEAAGVTVGQRDGFLIRTSGQSLKPRTEIPAIRSFS